MGIWIKNMEDGIVLINGLYVDGKYIMGYDNNDKNVCLAELKNDDEAKEILNKIWSYITTFHDKQNLSYDLSK